jgi:hypothetical protein
MTALDAERGFVLAGQLGRHGAEVVSRDGNNPGYEGAEQVETARVEIDGRAYSMELPREVAHRRS